MNATLIAGIVLTGTGLLGLVPTCIFANWAANQLDRDYFARVWACWGICVVLGVVIGPLLMQIGAHA